MSPPLYNAARALLRQRSPVFRSPSEAVLCHLNRSINNVMKKLFFAFLLLIGVTNSHGATILLQEDFQGGSAGDPISAPWVLSGTGTADYAATTQGLSAKITASTTTATAVNAVLSRSLDSAFHYEPGQLLTFSTDVLLTAVGGGETRTQMTLRLVGNGNLNLFAINFMPDRRVGVTNPSLGLDYFRTEDNSAFLLYTEDRWYTVTMTLDTATNLMDISLVDKSTLAVIGTLIGKAPVNQIDIQSFTAFRGGLNGQNQSFLLDNLSLTSIPEPSTALMLLSVAAIGIMVRRYNHI